MKYRITVGLIIALALILVVGFSGVALAYESVTMDKYKLTLGAVDEPKVTGQRIFMEFWVEDIETGKLVTGLEKTLYITLEKKMGGLKRAYKELEVVTFFGQPDRYKAAVYFTKPGEYTTHITGTIEETGVHEHIYFEVEEATQLMTPKVVEISAIDEDVETVIASAKDVAGRLGTVNTMTIVALILSIIATAGIVFSLVARRRNALATGDTQTASLLLTELSGKGGEAP